jgi:hypothetical protein
MATAYAPLTDEIAQIWPILRLSVFSSHGPALN